MTASSSMTSKLQNIKEFRAWLAKSAPDWLLSGADVEKTATGSYLLLFSLLHYGKPVARCECPMDALGYIGNEKLTAAYLRATT